MSHFKAKMHLNRFRLGLCPRLRWRSSLQHSPRPSSWTEGDLLCAVRGRRGKEGEERGSGKGGKGIGYRRGREEMEGEGKGERTRGRE